jgi:ABC-type Zn uptake system ZnuABC Zn-binding protein ZnuA
MFRQIVLPISLASTILLAACVAPTPLGGAQAANSSSAKLNVVATFSILGDLVKNVAGDNIELRTLVGPDADTHTFEPIPADGVALSSANVIFENGFGFETWLDDLYASSGSKARRVVVTEGLTAGVIGVGDEAGETDPHAWQDVTYTMSMVNLIRDALVKEDSANAETYTANAAAYLNQLSELDQYITQQVATIPTAHRKLVTNHDALGYFAQRYGFEIIGTALGTGSTDTGDPSAADIARLVDEVRNAGVPAIFTENVENSKVIEQVASEAGVVVGQPLYTDALSQPGSEGDTYLKMMHHNINAIVAGLRGE